MESEYPPLTSHGRKRGKERCGLNAKALERTAAVALADGLHPKHTNGRLRRYLDGLSIGHKGTRHRVHSNHIYCFGGEDVLITVLELPHAFRNAAARALKKLAPLSND